jgi:hypothetical protein
MAVEVVELWYFVVCSLGVEDDRHGFTVYVFFIFIDTQPPQATLYKRDVLFS